LLVRQNNPNYQTVCRAFQHQTTTTRYQIAKAGIISANIANINAIIMSSCKLRFIGIHSAWLVETSSRTYNLQKATSRTKHLSDIPNGTAKLSHGNTMNKASQAISLAFVNMFGLDSTTAGAVLFVSDGETSRSDEVQCSAVSVE
jgi:flagellar basal body rod protein FlgB